MDGTTVFLYAQVSKIIMSIDGIQPTPVVEAGQIMAEAMGKDWVRDRKEVVDYINRFREDLYLMYNEFKLFTNKFYCMELQEYTQPCSNLKHCDDTYYGVTIPEDIDGIMAVWQDDQPLQTYSKWWEARVGIVTKDRPQTHMSTTLVHEQHPTQRNLQKVTPLKFFADHVDDDGKVVTIIVDTLFDKRKEYRVELVGGGMVTIPDPVSSIRSVVLPSGLCGKVILLQEDGYELSEYSGYDTIPSYRRLKVSLECYNKCKSKRIMIHGNQKFKPVFFDSDIVEVGSRRILETAARFYRYGENSTDSEQLRKASLEENKLKKLLRGAMDRHRGNSERDPSQLVRRKRSIMRTSELSGYEGINRNRRRSSYNRYNNGRY